MKYDGKEITLVLKGNEVDVLDYLMLSSLSPSPMGKEAYQEVMSCLHDIRTQITQGLEEGRERKK